MKTIKQSIAPLATLLILAGCGGGHSNTQPLQGVFAGTVEDSNTHLINIILEDGSFWSAYGDQSGSDLYFAGINKGQLTSTKDGKFNVTYTKYFQPGDDISTGTGSGVYSRDSAAGSFTEAGHTLTFKTTRVSSQYYDYNKPASLSAIAGSWAGDLLDGEQATVDIDSEGIFSGSSSDGCKFTGTLEPHSDHNIFSFALNFGDDPCKHPNERASGIGLKMLREDGKNQLLVLGTTDSQKVGTLFSAVKS